MSTDPVRAPSQGNPLRSKFAGDPDMAELIELFVDELPNRVELISNSMQQSQYEALCRVSHQLKGASAGYGFDPIGQAAGVVESHLKALGPSADLAEVRAEVETLISLCRRAVK